MCPRVCRWPSIEPPGYPALSSFYRLREGGPRREASDFPETCGRGSGRWSPMPSLRFPSPRGLIYERTKARKT